MKFPLRSLIAGALLALCTVAVPLIAATVSDTIASVSATGTTTAVQSTAGMKTYQVAGSTASGTGSAVVTVQGSNNASAWDTVATVSLVLGTVTTSDSFTSNDSYAWTRTNVTTLSGSTPTLTVTRSR